MHPLLILKLAFLVGVANGAPVVAKDLLEDRFARPLDGGAKFLDGQPVFGASKTVRGIIASLAATTIAAPIVGIDLGVGALIAAAAMLGDLCSSFVKRRLRRQVHSRALGIDQIPESLLPLLVCADLLALSVADIAAATAIFFVGEILISRLLYRLHLRDRPY